MRTILFYILLTTHLLAQKQDSQFKINALTLPVAIINLGVEHSLTEHITIGADGIISPWKSFANNHLQMYIGFIEGRYYFKESMRHFYVGPNLGIGFFDLQKWNYWNTTKYQRGVTILTGITVGYQKKLNEHFGLEFFLGGGHSQGNYHGYEENVGRYEEAKKFNKSGEWLLYKGGIMITYQL